MLSPEFTAYYVERDPAGHVHGSIRRISQTSLPAGEVLIQAKWTSLNYKDALAATGHPGVAKRLPHVPDIDVAGIVAEVASDDLPSPQLEVGDEVLVTGHEIGAGQWGGWSEYVRVPRDWVIKRPATSTVLRMRFGLDDMQPHTLKEIGEQLGLTRERVRQIETEALGKLGDGLKDPREKAMEENWDFDD